MFHQGKGKRKQTAQSRQGKGKGKQTALSMTRKCQTSRAYHYAVNVAKAAGKGSEAAKEQGRIASDLCKGRIAADLCRRKSGWPDSTRSGPRPRSGLRKNWWVPILTGGRRF